MPQPIKVRSLHVQQFPAPRRTIGTQPHAIQRQPEHWFGDLMFSANSRDVGVVMLYRKEG